MTDYKESLGYIVPLYSVVATPIAPAAAATDLFIINGSASKVVRVRRIIVSHYAETAALANVSVIRRSAANTGGTSSVKTAVPRDTKFAAATAVAQSYSANPTLGTSVGLIQSRRVGAVIAGVALVSTVFDFASDGGVILRGVAEGLAVNLGGLTMAGNTFFDISMDFNEY